MKLDFNIVNLKQATKIYPRVEYILITGRIGHNLSHRVALKYFPNIKSININRQSEHIYQIFMNHLEDLADVYKSLIDEESKKTFYGYWLGCITNRISDIFYSNDAHYLTAGFIPAAGSIVIDGGAYDGETGKVFSEMGYKVYSFELDKNNFEKAKKVAEENHFVIENMGLGSYNHEANYNSSDTSSRVAPNAKEKAFITTIDSYVRKKNLHSVDFIKLDVEGAELDTLKGARTTIARFKPILALSAYHKWDDFWTLMNFVKSIRPDYEFALRHYGESIEEFPAAFDNYKLESFNKFNLEPVIYNWWECCLLAR